MAKWSDQNAVTQTELEMLLQRKLVNHLFITEEASGKFWLGASVADQPDLLHLVTRRKGEEPRMFVRLDVIYGFIRKTFDYDQPIAVMPHRKQQGLTKNRVSKVSQKGV